MIGTTWRLLAACAAAASRRSGAGAGRSWQARPASASPRPARGHGGRARPAPSRPRRAGDRARSRPRRCRGPVCLGVIGGHASVIVGKGERPAAGDRRGPGAGATGARRRVELGRDPGLPHPLEDVQGLPPSRTHPSRRRRRRGRGPRLHQRHLPQRPAAADPDLDRSGDRIRVGLTVLELRPRRRPLPRRRGPRSDPDRRRLAPVPSRELAQVPEPAEPQLGAVRVAAREPATSTPAVGRRIDQQLAPPPLRSGPDPPAPAPALPEAPTDETTPRCSGSPTTR